MSRSLAVAAAALLAIGLVALGGYAYFFSALRTSPRPLAASSPVAQASQSPSQASPAASASAAGSPLAGRWAVAPNSVVGYRVKEQFVNQTSTHEAVARTSEVTGGLTLAPAQSGLDATGLNFVARLASLQSEDQVAGFNVSQRDRLVTQSLAVQQYPTASFQADNVVLPQSLLSAGGGSLQIPGRLTVHGVTRQVQVNVQGQLGSNKLQVTGSTQIDMGDYGVTAPQVPITRVESQVTIEFQLILVRAT